MSEPAQGACLIGGAWTPGAGEHLHSADLISGEPAYRGHAADAAQVGAAFAAAAAAQPAWARRSHAERVALLRAFGKAVEARAGELRRAICLEVGKPRWEADTEVGAVRGKVELIIEAWEQRCVRPPESIGAARAVERRRPLGVIGVIGPSNFPAHLPNGQILPALVAGNAVVFKPSERTPLVGEILLRCLLDAGLPAELLGLVQGGRDVATAMLEDQRLGGLCFTGSAAVGRSLHRALAGRPEVLLALEMGGNNPLLVWDAGEAALVARQVLLSAFLTAGQRCTCARRLILPVGAEGDAVLAALQAQLHELRVGHHADEPEPFYGPLADRAAADAVVGHAESLLGSGAVALRALERSERHPALLRPGLIDVGPLDAPPDEECFGPLLQVERHDDFDAAVAACNRTRYGLSAGLISRRRELCERFISEVRAGVVNWNRQTTGASGRLPFGGLAASGNHRPAGWSIVDAVSDPVASLEVDECDAGPDLPGLPSL